MKHLLIISLIAVAPAVAPLAHGQEVTAEQQEALTSIARCLIPGLPQDWYQATVVVTLDAPGSASGEGRYLFSRQFSRMESEPFTPCANLNPAKLLVEMRALQPSDRRGWNVARFMLSRDGKFDLTYDYPKKD